MKKLFLTLYMFSLLCLLFAGCRAKEPIDNSSNPNYNTETYLNGTHYVQMDIADYGSIFLELDADTAPATVTNFINLVNDGFYNGLTFHRIINGFMMQGGDPEGTGLGGSEYTVPGEFALNDFKNPISHVRGTISMARAKDFNSASSQFFIMHQDSTQLDGSYAAFGKVFSGMDVVDLICSSVPVIDDDGTVRSTYEPIIETMTVLSPELVETLTQQEEPPRPAATATISFTPVTSTENAEVKDTWTIQEDGALYLLFSSEKLTNIGIYETDLSSGISYDSSNPIASYENLGAAEYIAVKINIPEETLPSLILVAEEPSGAIGQYLLAYDEYFGGAYLVPVIN